MESDILFTDEMIFEDFREMVRYVKPEIQCENDKKYFKLNILEHNSLNSTESNSQISPCSNNFFSTYLDNFEPNGFTETMSIASQYNEDSCSGSSLQQYNSQYDSDSGEDEITMTNWKPNNVDKLDICDSGNVREIDNESLNKLKAAIQVKWLDKAICIKKSMKHKNQIFLEKIDIKSKFRFYGKLFLLSETLNTTSKIRNKIPYEEVRYFIKRVEFHYVLPQIICTITENPLILYQPVPSFPYKERFHFNKRYGDERRHLYFKFSKINEFVKRSKSEEYIPKIAKNLENNNPQYFIEHRDNYRNIVVTLQKKNNFLTYEIENKNKHIGELNTILKNQIHQSNSNLQMAYEAIAKLKSDISLQNASIERLRNENSEIRKINENFRVFKENTEKIILHDRQNKELLQKKIESYSAVEDDNKWLYKAYIDYKNLCQDYDHLQIAYGDIENQLSTISQSFEESNYHIKYLENEINKYKQMENVVQSHENHNHEKRLDCHNYQCSCCPGTGSNHNKYKSRKKNMKPKYSSYGSEEDIKPVPRESETKIIQDVTYNNAVRDKEKKIDTKELENHYDDLQVKKRKLESELCHVPLNGSSSRRSTNASSMGDKEIIENELDKIDHELSSIRRTLKQCKVMGDR